MSGHALGQEVVQEIAGAGLAVLPRRHLALPVAIGGFLRGGLRRLPVYLGPVTGSSPSHGSRGRVCEVASPGHCRHGRGHAARWRSSVSRRTHNPQIAGSNPARATGEGHLEDPAVHLLSPGTARRLHLTRRWPSPPVSDRTVRGDGTRQCRVTQGCGGYREPSEPSRPAAFWCLRLRYGVDSPGRGGPTPSGSGVSLPAGFEAGSPVSDRWGFPAGGVPRLTEYDARECSPAPRSAGRGRGARPG